MKKKKKKKNEMIKSPCPLPFFPFLFSLLFSSRPKAQTSILFSFFFNSKPKPKAQFFKAIQIERKRERKMCTDGDRTRVPSDRIKLILSLIAEILQLTIVFQLNEQFICLKLQINQLNLTHGLLTCLSKPEFIWEF